MVNKNLIEAKIIQLADHRRFDRRIFKSVKPLRFYFCRNTNLLINNFTVLSQLELNFKQTYYYCYYPIPFSRSGQGGRP